MSEYMVRALDASTWDAFARLVDKHNGCGFGGCWCTWFHTREGRPEGEVGRPWKERLVREGKAHAALVFGTDRFAMPVFPLALVNLVVCAPVLARSAHVARATREEVPVGAIGT